MPPKKKVKTSDNVSVTQNGADRSFASNIPPLQAATDEEKRAWQGFCEVESEPAFFNVMLKEFGVRGVKVQEVFGLDDELLAVLPKPVYGLIFLFRYREVDVDKQEASCPPQVWFANQVVGNACATVALLNIVNNVPCLELGDHLQSFKDFTQDFTPALRGHQVANFQFVKTIHNSFARKMDMLNIDLGMKQDYDARNKRPKRGKSTTPAKSKRAAKESEPDDDDDSAFHFIAYMPIGDSVWKLDGLDRQPQNLGSFEPQPPDISNPNSEHSNTDSTDWLSTIKPVLKTRMAEYEEGQIEFGLLTLVKDPTIHHRAQLGANIASLLAVEARLDLFNPDWRAFLSSGAAAAVADNTGVLRGASAAYGISSADVDTAFIPDSIKNKLLAACPTALMATRGELVTSQVGLRLAVKEEEECVRQDEEKAACRRRDYGPFIQTWLRMLADNGTLQEMVREQLA
ncbi:hypothetical protein B0A49_11195 [Cryomyces minteri]|uniref:Ubiquitin carboxyl-terminal hydrolase n=1 Tax=Cryomyces minteri TaxID=331657 RepID=A0A4U0WGG7_9PEZI|nr:hypothetical protein B0A49_11195 [Cryomyces minteri]